MKHRKRTIDLQNADEVIAEIERLRTWGYTPTKRWNLSQVCQHLTKTMEGEMSGLGFRIPWLLRRTVGTWLTRRVLSKRTMPSVPTLPSLQPDHRETDDDSLVDECVVSVRRCEEFDGSLRDYPFVDGLTHDQWRQFMWIHASHHLSYLVPTEEDLRQSVQG